MNPQQFNFKPLDGKLSTKWQLTKQILRRHSRNYLITLAVAIPLIIIAGAPGLLILFILFVQMGAEFMGLTTAIVSGQVHLARDAEKQAMLAQFAILNGYYYDPRPSIDKYSVYFDHRHDYASTDAIYGSLHKWPFRILNYGYDQKDKYNIQISSPYLNTIQKILHQLPARNLRKFLLEGFSGYQMAQRSEAHTHVTVLQIQLPVATPHIFIDSRHDRTIFARKISNKHKLVLEGNFNEHFNVYVAKKFEVEALDILSPDFMEFLINLPAKVDLEFLGNNVFIYLESPKGQLAEYKTMFKLADIVVLNLASKLKAWKYNKGRRKHSPIRQR